MNLYFKSFLYLVLIGFSVSSCQPESSIKETEDITNKTSLKDSKFLQNWLNTYMVVEKDLPAFRPAATSRALSYIWMAAYETGLPGMPNFISNSTKLGFTVPKITKSVEDYNWPIAINASLGETYRHFLINRSPEHTKIINDQEEAERSRLSAGIDASIITNSEAWGKEVAKAIIAYAVTDVEAEAQIKDAFAKNYTPPTGPGKWKGTTGSALFPYWGKTRTFATFGSQLISPPPPVYSTNPQSEYYKDFYEVYLQSYKNLQTDGRWRGEFWSDDIVGLTFSPPARIFQIANQIMAIENLNLESSLHLLLKLGIAENDAAVAAWGSKYIYNVERPIHFITSDEANIDKNFKPLLGQSVGVASGMTPPFPGYPSGHSTFGGIGEAVLDEFFGKAYTFTDRCHEGRTEFMGYPRTYTTNRAAAEENAFSRIPLGVHPRFDCTEGLRLGRVVGQNAVNYKVTKN